MEATTTVVVPDRRLGKLPPKFDARTLRLSKYATKKALRTHPKTQNRLNRTAKFYGLPDGYPMYANDDWGDCTCVGVAHADATFRAWGSGETPFTEAQVLALYRRYCGWDGTPATDNGGYLLDVLKGARQDGIIHAFVALNPQNHAQMKTAIDIFGGVYAGVMLPVSAQDEKVWTRTTGVGSEPWSWGGHAIWIPRYTTKVYTCVTWSEPQDMTYEWQHRYMDEAFAIIDNDWLRRNGKTVKGMDMTALEADLQVVINL